MNHVRLQIILFNTSYPGYRFEYVPKGNDMFIRVTCPKGTCNVTGEAKAWNGRKWYISPHMTESEVVGTLFLAVKTAVEHEMREQFKYDNEAIYGPHWDVNKLVAIAPHAHTDERK